MEICYPIIRGKGKMEKKEDIYLTAALALLHTDPVTTKQCHQQIFVITECAK